MVRPIGYRWIVSTCFLLTIKKCALLLLYFIYSNITNWLAGMQGWLLRPRVGAKYCDQARLYVCPSDWLSVWLRLFVCAFTCLSARVSQEEISILWPLVLLWWLCSMPMLCTSGFVDNVKCIHIMKRMGQIESNDLDTSILSNVLKCADKSRCA